MVKKRTETGEFGLQAARLVPGLTAVSRAVNKLIVTLESIDEIQKNVMSLGMETNVAMDKMGGKIVGHPGGFKMAFESSLDLMKAGLLNHSKGMIRLVQQAKVTGQNHQQIISGFAKLSSVLPMSAKAMGKLGDQVIDLSLTWGIQTTALMDVLERHAKTISTVAALGGDPAEATKAIAEATAQAGKQFAPTIGMLAEKFTFKGGAEDLSKAVIQLGNRQDLVQRLRTEDMSAGLLAEINSAILKNYDENVTRGGGDRFIAGLIAQGLTFDVTQISAMRAFEQAFEKRSGTLERGLKENEVNFSASIGTMIHELTVPIQEILIPAAVAIANTLTLLRTETGGFWAGIVRWTVKMFALLTIVKALALTRNLYLFRSMFTGLTIPGVIALVVGGVSLAIYEATKSREKIAENEDRARRALSKAAGDDTVAWRRYMTAGIIAASLTSQNEFLPVALSQKELLERIMFAIFKGNTDRLDVVPTAPPIGGK